MATTPLKFLTSEKRFITPQDFIVPPSQLNPTVIKNRQHSG